MDIIRNSQGLTSLPCYQVKIRFEVDAYQCDYLRYMVSIHIGESYSFCVAPFHIRLTIPFIKDGVS